MAERIKHLASLLLSTESAAYARHGIEHELRRLYWDTGYYPAAPAMNALLSFSPLDRVLFGSDSPFVDVATNRKALDDLHLRPDKQLAIERGNALQLWPELEAPLFAAQLPSFR
jgi:predicted TIM-barrel fold metal-dependent hydrolase